MGKGEEEDQKQLKWIHLEVYEESSRMAIDRKCWHGFISQLLEEEDTHKVTAILVLSQIFLMF